MAIEAEEEEKQRDEAMEEIQVEKDEEVKEEVK